MVKTHLSDLSSKKSKANAEKGAAFLNNETKWIIEVEYKSLFLSRPLLLSITPLQYLLSTLLTRVIELILN
jgi:hypothetical protein